MGMILSERGDGLVARFVRTFFDLRDILPIVLLFGFFQLAVRRRVANLGTILAGHGWSSA